MTMGSLSLSRPLIRATFCAFLALLPLGAAWNLVAAQYFPKRAIKIGPTLGGVTYDQAVNLSWQDIRDGKFQKAVVSRVTDAMPIRPLLIRINNEIRFHLFGELTAPNVFRGAHGQLIEQTYLDDYCSRTEGMGAKLAAEAAEGRVIIELKPREAVGFDHDARGQVAEARADHRDIELPRRALCAGDLRLEADFRCLIAERREEDIQEIGEFAVGAFRRLRHRIGEVEGRNQLAPGEAIDLVDDRGDSDRAADVVPVNAALRKQVEGVGALEQVNKACGIDDVDALAPQGADILRNQLCSRLLRARARDAIDEIFR